MLKNSESIFCELIANSEGTNLFLSNLDTKSIYKAD